MSNWCTHTLVINGEKDDLAPFAEKLFASWHYYKDDPTEGQFELLRTFLPIPDDIYFGYPSDQKFVASALKGRKADDSDGYMAPWTQDQIETAKKKYGEYDWIFCFWRGDNWGSETADLKTTMEEYGHTHIKITYGSHVFPILGGILNISKIYPLLTFSLDYQEDQGNYPAGGYKFKGGEVLFQWEDPEESNESCPIHNLPDEKEIKINANESQDKLEEMEHIFSDLQTKYTEAVDAHNKAEERVSAVKDGGDEEETIKAAAAAYWALCKKDKIAEELEFISQEILYEQHVVACSRSVSNYSLEELLRAALEKSQKISQYENEILF